ncbi:MAG: hypothetical protein J6C95_01755 [Muribaculaceae bacterium]|nr:hypothetical protein [Muribaculaceae bacterium]
MKKLLLTLAAVVGLGFAANAAEVTIATTNAITWTATSDGFTATSDGFTLTMAKGTSSTALVTPDATAARIYQGSTFTITAPDGVVMEKVAMTEVHSKGTQLSHASFSEGWTAYGQLTSSTKAEEFGATSDGLTSITMTAGKQLRVSQVVITYTSVLSGDQEPAGLSFDETAVTAVEGQAFTAPTLNNPNNLPVVWSSSDEAVATVNNGAVTIKGAGTTTISAKSEETTEFGACNASYTLTVVKAYKTVADFYTVGAKNNGVIGFDLTVAYVNGTYNYATTGTEWTLVYGYDLGLKVGDVIPAGWEGTYSPFSGLPEIAPVKLPEITETGKTVTFAEATDVTLDMINQVVVLKGVKFDAATIGADDAKTEFTGTIGESSIKFLNKFKTASVEKGTYNVTCAVSYYVKGATEATDATGLQVFPIAYEAVSTGIDNIEAADNAPVEYFNLQGVRVANPENGLYIRRQGNKVTKVIVK